MDKSYVAKTASALLFSGIMKELLDSCCLDKIVLHDGKGQNRR